MAADWLHLHPLNPQKRLLEKAAARVREGAVIVYPTDSCYALGCHPGDKAAAERIRAIRKFGRHHLFTLVCRDLSDLGSWARVDNVQFRLLKSMTPGPITFVLRARGSAPRRLMHERRKTIGLRVPDHLITQSLLAALGEPLVSCTLMLPDDGLPISDPELAYQRLHHLVDVVLHGGNCGYQPTSVVDLTEPQPRLIRKGKGDVSRLFPEIAEPPAPAV
ncbi:MAG TPA: L-threonylcarbamoyladenylate synthase [Candidatus Binatia bacterium]|nr:L-threonylcarbamoyladenylate synthase [Candidatus Binatia bacterium]